MAEDLQIRHREISDDLPLFAVGALDAAACTRLRSHLEECPACRRELEELRAGTATLALSVYGPAPPQRAREKFLAALAKEKNAAAEQVSYAPRAWWSLAPLFASLVLAIFAILLWRDNSLLKRANEGLQTELHQSQQQNRHAREVMDLMGAADAAHVVLVSTGARPMPEVKTVYQRRTGKLLVMANNLAPLPPDKTYQLWLLPMHGAPMAAVTFKPNAQGSAMAMPEKTEIAAGTEAKGFAVTIEPEGGSETPTMPVVMASTGG